MPATPEQLLELLTRLEISHVTHTHAPVFTVEEATAETGHLKGGHSKNLFLKDKINPLIGAAGVSAVPMAARCVHKVGSEANRRNYLLMYAMGPNVAGVIGSAVAAGVLLAVVGG